MSYNGIGLSTARGSGTNGFIQKNYSRSTESSYSRRQKNKQNDLKRDSIITNIQDPELVKHDEKRKIDLKVSEYRDELEDQEDLDDDEINEKCKKFKEDLIKDLNVKQGYKSRRSREEKVEKKEEPVDY